MKEILRNLAYNRELKKELRNSLKAIEKELVEKELKRQSLITHNTDFAMLEDFIKEVNDNPNLKIKMTTRDGTVLELETKPDAKRKTYTEMLGEING